MNPVYSAEGKFTPARTQPLRISPDLTDSFLFLLLGQGAFLFSLALLWFLVSLLDHPLDYKRGTPQEYVAVRGMGWGAWAALSLMGLFKAYQYFKIEFTHPISKAVRTRLILIWIATALFMFEAAEILLCSDLFVPLLSGVVLLFLPLWVFPQVWQRTRPRDPDHTLFDIYLFAGTGALYGLGLLYVTLVGLHESCFNLPGLIAGFWTEPLVFDECSNWFTLDYSRALVLMTLAMSMLYFLGMGALKYICYGWGFAQTLAGCNFRAAFWMVSLYLASNWMNFLLIEDASIKGALHATMYVFAGTILLGRFWIYLLDLERKAAAIRILVYVFFGLPLLVLPVAAGFYGAAKEAITMHPKEWRWPQSLPDSVRGELVTVFKNQFPMTVFFRTGLANAEQYRAGMREYGLTRYEWDAWFRRYPKDASEFIAQIEHPVSQLNIYVGMEAALRWGPASFIRKTLREEADWQSFTKLIWAARSRSSLRPYYNDLKQIFESQVNKNYEVFTAMLLADYEDAKKNALRYTTLPFADGEKYATACLFGFEHYNWYVDFDAEFVHALLIHPDTGYNWIVISRLVRLTEWESGYFPSVPAYIYSRQVTERVMNEQCREDLERFLFLRAGEGLSLQDRVVTVFCNYFKIPHTDKDDPLECQQQIFEQEQLLRFKELP